ncbi:MAG: hypothetical protein OHK0038_24510 [Flammeovirgaceae bacterium]
MSFEVKGKLEVIYDEAQVTEKFKKREFVLMIQDGMYPEYPKFQVVQEKCSLLNSFKVGDEIIVSFNLKGRPSTKNGVTSYFTNLDVWKIVPANSSETNTSKSSSVSNSSASNKNTLSSASSTMKSEITGMTFTEASEDELPF